MKLAFTYDSLLETQPEEVTISMRLPSSDWHLDRYFIIVKSSVATC